MAQAKTLTKEELAHVLEYIDTRRLTHNRSAFHLANGSTNSLQLQQGAAGGLRRKPGCH